MDVVKRYLYIFIMKEMAERFIRMRAYPEPASMDNGDLEKNGDSTHRTFLDKIKQGLGRSIK